jgi:hypothetical protein
MNEDEKFFRFVGIYLLLLFFVWLASLIRSLIFKFSGTMVDSPFCYELLISMIITQFYCLGGYYGYQNLTLKRFLKALVVNSILTFLAWLIGTPVGMMSAFGM